MSNRGLEPPNAWAELIRAITDREGWSVRRLATESGIHRSTIFRWRNGELPGAAQTVRLVADTASVDFNTALLASGLAPDDTPGDDDWELRMIRDSGLPGPVIDQLVRDTLDRRLREQASRRRDLERQISLLRGASTNTT